jgi:hypothetical protein
LAERDEQGLALTAIPSDFHNVLQLMQTVPVASRGFKSTTNARNEAMFKEATDFSLRIKMLEKDLKSVLKTLESKCNGSAYSEGR